MYIVWDICETRRSNNVLFFDQNMYQVDIVHRKYALKWHTVPMVLDGDRDW